MMMPLLPGLQRARGVLSRFVWLLLLCLWVTPVLAQTRYTNTTDGTISETVTPCSSPMLRTFSVAGGTVTDVEIGVLLAHTWRADLIMVLKSPDGTAVTLASGVGGDVDNFNVQLDDANGTAISAHTTADTATSTTVVPPYQRTGTFAPASPLSAFNGRSAGGTWTLEICDAATGDSGTFYQADLTITTGPVTTADLSLAMSVSSAAPQSGVQVSYTLTVASAATSGGTATGIQVSGALPASFTFRSSSGTGTFDSATGLWSVGSLAPGASASITIVGANNSVAGTAVPHSVQITASSLPDPDSTVNNSVISEDDYAAASYTTAAYPSAGTAPSFTCAAGSNAFDWDSRSWTTGALTGSWTINSIPVSLTIAGSTSRLQADPASGNMTPVRNSSSTNSGNGNTLMLAVDLAASSETVTATWAFTSGVAGLRFTVADIDLFYGQFVDRVSVTGSYNGVAVTPILTQGQSNSVSGSVATATALAANDNAAGNVIVTFDRPVDTVTITYGADTASSPANPGIQAIALMDMSFCNRATDLSLSKTVSNAAPATGSSLSYTLTVANTAAAAMSASGITVSDVLPAGFTFGSVSGTGTYTSGTGVWTLGSLAAGASASITITGTASGAIGASVTNTAQITASSLPDPDSTANNGVTSEDDYAAVSFTISGTINCPAGSTATGSGYAASGTGANLGRIFWLDWSCGATSGFPAGATVNKTWDAGDGLVITGQLTSITATLRPYTVGTWGGDILDDMYAGLNPIGLRNNDNGGEDPQFTLALSASLNGVAVPLRYVIGDAEDAGGAASNESIAATTNGTAWSLLESAGSITVTNTGSSATIYDPADGGGGTAILETTATSLSLGMTYMGAGGTAAAFGFTTPYDWSDGPVTGTSYGSANHRIISALRMGAGVTAENAAYDNAAASADSDDGVTLPELSRGVAAAVPVSVTAGGYLNAWIDFNDDGDFADAGEQVASNVTDGGAGDSDGTANGTILLPVTPPAGAATTPTIARFRYSSKSGGSVSGLYGYGEVEDYGLSILTPGLGVTKVSSLISDPVNGTGAGRMAIPGAVIEYCILVTNTGTATAGNIVASDPLPATMTYVSGTLASGTGCATASTPEDDNAAGADETDPRGAAYSGTTVTASTATLPAAGTFAITFRVTVN